MVFTAGDKFSVERVDGFWYVYEGDHAIFETRYEHEARKYADTLNRALWYKNRHSAHTLAGGPGREATNLAG